MTIEQITKEGDLQAIIHDAAREVVPKAKRTARKKTTRKEIEALTIRTVAAHEAGHMTIACLWGAPLPPDKTISAAIYPALLKEFRDAGEWEGHCLATFPGDIAGMFNGIYSVAGYVAECIELGVDKYVSVILEIWKCGGRGPSSTDLRGIPDDWDMREVLVILALNTLRKHRSLFNKITRRLIENKAVTQHEFRTEIRDFRRRLEAKTHKSLFSSGGKHRG